MLRRRRPEPVMCGRGLRALCPWEAAPQEPPRGACSKPRGRGGRPGWQRRGGGGGGARRGWGPPTRAAPPPQCLLRLRPVNLQGKRAPGMRAPRNTNQFLMQEKYQLLQLRSDSVGSAESGSDGELEPLDVEQYLGALELARGGPPDLPPPEDSSLQYYPSEDDVLQSRAFMERDFQQFCSSIC